MGLIEICNFADEFSLLFNPKLGLCSWWKLTHLFLTAVMFLLVGRAWEDQVSSPPVGSNNFSTRDWFHKTLNIVFLVETLNIV